MLEARKAPGPDGNPPEVLKTDAETTEDRLTPPLQEGKERDVPAKWKKGFP
ncbi:unnamed protein product, partial [Heterobilharzia americana]